jgi:hypothetical protein
MTKRLIANGAFAAMATLTALASLTGTSAQAQTSNFVGFSAAVNGELANSTSTATDGSSSGSQRGGVGLQARYGWALGSDFVLGVGATADIGKRPAGSFANGADVYSTQNYSLNVEPGYAISKDLLVYGKVSTLSASVGSDDGSSTTPVQGVGYGVGVRAMLNQNTYWQAGVDNYRLNDASLNTGTTAALRGNVVSVGLGYNF